jgi:hypothetical protein
MACTMRPTETCRLGQFKKEGSISIEDSLITLIQPGQLEGLI